MVEKIAQLNRVPSLIGGHSPMAFLVVLRQVRLKGSRFLCLLLLAMVLSTMITTVILANEYFDSTAAPLSDPFFLDAVAELSLTTAYDPATPIPNYSFVIWDTLTLPSRAKFVSDMWVLKEPHMRRVVATSQPCHDLVIKYSQEVDGGRALREVYRAFPVKAMQADVCRLVLLYFFGGVYMDLDVLWHTPRRAFEDLPRGGMIVGHSLENTSEYANWFFAAQRRHPCLKAVIEVVIARGANVVAESFRLQRKYDVPFISGSGAFTAGLSQCQLRHPVVVSQMTSPLVVRHVEASVRWVVHEPQGTGDGYVSWRRQVDQWWHQVEYSRLRRLVASGDVDDNVTYSDHDTIPRHSFVIWKSELLPKKALSVDARWRRLEPSMIRLVLTDKACRNLASRYNGLLPLYDAMPVNVMRADTCRVLAVYYYGGIYMDLDVDWVKPIDSFFQFNASIQVGNETADGHHICNWFFGASRRHPCLKRVLDVIVERSARVDFAFPHFVHHTTGPAAFTAGLGNCTSAAWSNTQMNTQYILHLYGSQAWKGDYKSWVAEKENIRRARVSS